jgi:NADH-quinone oxidoreductase subunit F
MARAHWLLPDAPYASYAAYSEAMGGRAIEKARTLGPQGVIDVVHRSGLRGRGGAGFPTGVKWRGIANHPCPTRYVVCNAAEGEPGTFKDRFLIRHNPYAVIEGIVIAARTVGATGSYIAIKASFKKEIARLRAALNEMSAVLPEGGVTIVEGPEEYLFGEEKAMLNVIEGEGPFPREADDPPYEHGLFATATSPNPALANNAETLAHIPSIVLHGSETFRAIGTTDTPGTILCTLSGDLARPGVVEVEAGTPLSTLFRQHGGGPRPGRTLRAAISGVSSGVLLADQFDTPADFASLAMLGSGLGSAGFIVLDDSTSIPRVTQAVTRFLYVESCNQCSACKTDLRIASRALDAFFEPGAAAPDLLERVVVGVKHAPQGNRCYLPVEASVLVSSLVRRFRGDFDARGAGKAVNDAVWTIPKIVDYDAENHVFTYDPMQPRKTPTWTYEEPPVPSAPKPVALPKERATGPVHVRLSQDIGHEMLERARLAGTDVHEHVNHILADWLKTQDKHPK